MAKKDKPPVEKPFLFVDLSNLVYKNASSLHFLRTPEGLSTGGIFGTIRNLLTWSQKFRVWVFVDGYGTQRKDLIKGYKSGRKDTYFTADSKPSEVRGKPKEFATVDDAEGWDEFQTLATEIEAKVEAELNPQPESLKKTVYANIAVLANCLPHFGFPVVYHQEFEADDLIGATVYLRERAALTLPSIPEVYIFSTDKDFDQLPAHRLSPMKQHGKYANGKSPIKDFYFLGAKTLACFPEIPVDSFLRACPYTLSIYRSIVGDVSDKIKGIMTPLKAWKGGPPYPADTIIKRVLEVLRPGYTWMASDYLNYVWDLDTAFRDVDHFKAALSDLPEALLTNLQVTKLPIDLVRTAADPVIKAFTANGPVTAPLANFWVPDLLPPDFEGWSVEHSEVEAVCKTYQMPSINTKLAEVQMMTQHVPQGLK